MKATITASLRRTIALLKVADSRIPMIKRTVTAKTTKTAGRLTHAPVATHPVACAAADAAAGAHSSTARVAKEYGACESSMGKTTPKSFRKLTAYPDQPTATADDAKRYSRIKSHPMIQARSSPMVAYAYV